mmetsp:Transcript_23006/g.34084  ORF Transcript_23006/g.34084 Transcript_23006/m.34084 type:complete len:253 (-) Transcript_23006:18-776(-)
MVLVHVTRSGHIYSREAIVSYLLIKNKELKQQRERYEAQITTDAQQEHTETETSSSLAIQAFIEKDQGSTQKSTQDHAIAYKKSLKRSIDTESKEDGNKRLKEISYWLSEAQPEYDNQAETIRNNPPPARPSSPMSGEPLRLKDLTSITLMREGDNNGDKGNGGKNAAGGKCMCAVSNKAITTQPVVAIKKTGVVMLKDVYDSVVKATTEKLMCPITGQKFKEKDVLELKKGRSGFAASGKITASKYVPTLT